MFYDIIIYFTNFTNFTTIRRVPFGTLEQSGRVTLNSWGSGVINFLVKARVYVKAGYHSRTLVQVNKC